MDGTQSTKSEERLKKRTNREGLPTRSASIRSPWLPSRLGHRGLQGASERSAPVGWNAYMLVVGNGQLAIAVSGMDVNMNASHEEQDTHESFRGLHTLWSGGADSSGSDLDYHFVG